MAPAAPQFSRNEASLHPLGVRAAGIWCVPIPRPQLLSETYKGGFFPKVLWRSGRLLHRWAIHDISPLCSANGCSWDALSFCFCECTSTKETKFRLCRKLEPARDDDMACAGGVGFEVRKLVDKTWPGKPDSKNPRTAVMFGVQSFLLHRHEFVQSCWLCQGSLPETVTDSPRVASRYASHQSLSGRVLALRQRNGLSCFTLLMVTGAKHCRSLASSI